MPRSDTSAFRRGRIGRRAVFRPAYLRSAQSPRPLSSRCGARVRIQSATRLIEIQSVAMGHRQDTAPPECHSYAFLVLLSQSRPQFRWAVCTPSPKRQGSTQRARAKIKRRPISAISAKSIRQVSQKMNPADFLAAQTGGFAIFHHGDVHGHKARRQTVHAVLSKQAHQDGTSGIGTGVGMTDIYDQAQRSATGSTDQIRQTANSLIHPATDTAQKSRMDPQRKAEDRRGSGDKDRRAPRHRSSATAGAPSNPCPKQELSEEEGSPIRSPTISPSP